MSRTTRRPAVVVDDLEALDERIAAYTDTYTFAESTQVTRTKAWGWWVAHCKALEVNEYDAPLEVFESALLARRLDGRRYSSSHLSNVLSAVRARYGERRLVPAPDRPAHRASWEELTRGRRNQIGLLRARGELVAHENIPLTRELVERILLTANLPRSENPAGERQVDAVCAASLLALDTTLSRSAIGGLQRSDVQMLPGVGVRLLDRVLDCDHRERQRGVPWDCTACSLCAVLLAHDGLSPYLFCSAATREEVRRWLRTRARAWPALEAPQGRTERLRPAFLMSLEPGSWQAAGLRRGLVVNARQPHSVSWVRGRAWVSMSFEAGLRMCSDVVRLPRSAIGQTRDGSGWRLRLGVTKDDPLAQKQVERVFKFREDGGPCAAQALSEYLCVRDAAVGVEGPLLLGARGGLLAGKGPLVKPVQAAKFDLDLLSELADLPQRHTSYSARKGFGQQTSSDGWELEKTMAALRHRKPETTKLYTGTQGAKRVAEKFIAAGAGAAK